MQYLRLPARPDFAALYQRWGAPVTGLPHQRMGHLDALRGIAALLVVWLHVTGHMTRWRLEGPDSSFFLADWAQQVEFGRLGVMLFFAISGFIVPQSLQAGPGGLRRFAIRRFFRLFPLYWVSIPLGLVTAWWVYEKPIPASDVWLNITMLPTLFDYTMVLGLYWTLEIELYFYSLLALLLLMRVHTSWPVIMLLATLLVYFRGEVTEHELRDAFGVTLQEANQWQETAQYLAIMLWGSAVRLLWDYWQAFRLRAQHGFQQVQLSRLLLQGGALVLLTLFLLNRPLTILQMASGPDQEALIQYALPIVLTVVIFIGWIFCRWLSPAPLVWLGAISYSIYLIHPVVLYSVDVVICQPDDNLLCTSDYNLSLATYLVICVVLTVLASALLYRWVEQPAIQLGRKLTRRH